MDFLRDPAWQFIGAIISLLALVLATYADRDRIFVGRSMETEGVAKKPRHLLAFQLSPRVAFFLGVSLTAVVVLVVGAWLTTADSRAVRGVIETEVSAAAERNFPVLESIYSSDAIVIDRMRTSRDTTDDQIYVGWENIRQEHYIGLIAFYNPTTMSLVDMSVQIYGNKATGIHRGVIINDVYYEDVSVYTLEKRGGRWLITQLEFGNG